MNASVQVWCCLLCIPTATFLFYTLLSCQEWRFACEMWFTFGAINRKRIRFQSLSLAEYVFGRLTYPCGFWIVALLVLPFSLFFCLGLRFVFITDRHWWHPLPLTSIIQYYPQGCWRESPLRGWNEDKQEKKKDILSDSNQSE